MSKVVLILAFMACKCHGHRVQTPPVELQSNALEETQRLAMLLLSLHPVAAFDPSSIAASAVHSRSLRMQASSSAARHATAVASSLSRRQSLTGGAAAAAAALPFAANAGDYPKLKIETTQGVMEFELWNDVAPKHVESFLKLSKQGFFDGGAFHRIIPGFVIQGGDPNAKIGYGTDGKLSSGDRGAQSKWGTGGPGYTIPAEFNSRKHEFGVLSAARAQDPNSAGSQFFVCLGSLPSLDNKYTVFGKLVSGADVLKRIAAAPTDDRDRPLSRQGIEKMADLAVVPT